MVPRNSRGLSHRQEVIAGPMTLAAGSGGGAQAGACSAQDAGHEINGPKTVAESWRWEHVMVGGSGSDVHNGMMM